ncbi:MAG: RsmB/NOP family class I SAM-dependent RNA methyltransferase [Verrucomicrobia bacterium]|nr:RsmB/NOP family class I SAM-dependent RNA methyltransferase [Verrucomicrobiota bacterium]
MADQSTLDRAARVLAALPAGQRADHALRAYFARHHKLPPSARREITRTVFAYFRWLGWLDPNTPWQQRVAHAAILQGQFAAHPASIKPAALAARAVPSWVRDEMELPADFLRQLQREPALWLRARPGGAARLAASLGDCQTTGLAPDALRYTGPQDLFRTPQFHDGSFEIQDLASQLVGHACAPRPGETWWDACAGEGGKTLHLADLMGNSGVVWATDRNARRLDTLRRRAARAQLFNYRVALWAGPAPGDAHAAPKLPTKTRFDGILVDAPCSGIGTWQRNPHARWTTTPADLRELAAVQLALLHQVAGSLKPGGRLLYAVCTLTRRETVEVADAFAAAHPELAPCPLFAAEPRIILWPQTIEANGMFIAAWRRP